MHATLTARKNAHSRRQERTALARQALRLKAKKCRWAAQICASRALRADDREDLSLEERAARVQSWRGWQARMIQLAEVI